MACFKHQKKTTTQPAFFH